MEKVKDSINALSRDPILKKIIGNTVLENTYYSPSCFETLIRSIVSQQISVAAAASIWKKFTDKLTGKNFIPEVILEFPKEDLRSNGISNQKANYIHNVAQFFLEHQITESYIDGLDNDEIIKLLTQIKGIGIWTVQMMLMFHLHRPDVFPSGDLGLQNKMKILYDLQLEKKQLLIEMKKIAEHWRPYRTLASRYIWSCSLEE